MTSDEAKRLKPGDVVVVSALGSAASARVYNGRRGVELPLGLLLVVVRRPLRGSGRGYDVLAFDWFGGCAYWVDPWVVSLAVSARALAAALGLSRAVPSPDLLVALRAAVREHGMLDVLGWLLDVGAEHGQDDAVEAALADFVERCGFVPPPDPAVERAREREVDQLRLHRAQLMQDMDALRDLVGVDEFIGWLSTRARMNAAREAEFAAERRLAEVEGDAVAVAADRAELYSLQSALHRVGVEAAKRKAAWLVDLVSSLRAKAKADRAEVEAGDDALPSLRARLGSDVRAWRCRPARLARGPRVRGPLGRSPRRVQRAVCARRQLPRPGRDDSCRALGACPVDEPARGVQSSASVARKKSRGAALPVRGPKLGGVDRGFCVGDKVVLADGPFAGRVGVLVLVWAAPSPVGPTGESAPPVPMARVSLNIGREAEVRLAWCRFVG